MTFLFYGFVEYAYVYGYGFKCLKGFVDRAFVKDHSSVSVKHDLAINYLHNNESFFYTIAINFITR